MDEKDKKFMAYLRKNSRETLTRISRFTGIPISTLYDRLKQHEKSMIIKHTCLLDFEKLGYLCRANIALKVSVGDRDKIKSRLLSLNQVNNLYRINNGYDYMIEGVFKHLKEMEEFMETLETDYQIDDKQIYYIINDEKRECFLADV
jgi:DNA-binding Lrp family transcriptional regulator